MNGPFATGFILAILATVARGDRSFFILSFMALAMAIGGLCVWFADRPKKQ